MLISIAIGDAYGAAFEYANEMQQFNNAKQYYKHPRHDIACGQYTDDTQMSLALAELLLTGEEITDISVATAFVHAFKRDWIDGYARGFQAFLENVKDGREFLDKIKPDSDKSGAAMRAMPLGVLGSVKEIMEASTIQAQVTHNTPSGIASAKASALATHYFVYGKGHLSDLGRFLDYYVPEYSWNKDWVGKVKSKGWMSVRAAITAIKKTRSQSELLKECVAFTGDTDTVAAIAMGITAKSVFHSKDITSNKTHPLMTGLENGKFGKSYLEEISEALWRLV